MREGTSSPHALLGRRDECRIVDEMLAAVRGGRSVAVVVRGEPGIGKTALLQYAERSASDFTIARAAATEVEMELAFGGLHQLCTPFLKDLGLLPVPQRHALETAFGLSAGTPPDRFLVGLAVLTLLTGAAEEHPLLCLVDDAQWLDRVSAQTLAFVARRLVADRIGLFFAMREPVEKHELAGLRQLEVVGLSHDYARALLSSATPGRLDERIRERILAEARGNPLALLVLPQGLTPAELAGGFGLPSGRTVAQHIETEFARRLETLPADTRRLLLVAAADAIGDVPLLWRAAQRLGIGPEAAADAESAGFIEFGARARFLHPMLRAAVYRAAPAEERRAAHGALAEATDERIDPEGRAWHRAHACLGPDEQVACELERSAELVRSRGGIAAAAAFLQRAAELTLDPDRRTARALAAAEASFRAGSLEAAYDLLASAELGAIDQLRRARLDRLRGQILFASGHAREASALMLNAATSMQVLDDRDLRETYVEAFNVAIIVGRLAQQGGIQAVADAARRARPATPPPTAMDLLLDGLTTRFTQGYTAALPELRRALTAFRTDAEQNRDCLLRWLWLACPVAPEPLAPDLWEDDAWHQLAAHAVEFARELGAVAVLPLALSYRAYVHVLAGEFAEASELLEESDRLAAAASIERPLDPRLLLVAWQGHHAEATQLIETERHNASARGEGRVLGFLDYVTAVLCNGLGRYPGALDAAQKACAHEDVGFFGLALAEMVEAAARSDEPEAAAEALHELEGRTVAAGTDWALGILARSRALLSEATVAEAHYREALERLERSRITVGLARAHLVYGEWLRRQNRRLDARAQLRVAHEMFQRFGAAAFAQRAGDELAATGETVRRRSTTSRDQLTAQEAQIARLAGDGFTNPEIGAQLFLSPHTVEWHLRKVFAKLGVTSRRQLKARLASPALTL